MNGFTQQAHYYDNHYRTRDEEEQHEKSTDESWEDPLPLHGGEIQDLPQFPMEALPIRVYRPFTESVAAVVQVDPGMAGAMCLATLSLCARGKYDIVLPSHTEPLALYIAATASSGERKSQTNREFTQPVFDYAAALKEELAPQRRQALNRQAILEKKQDRHRKKVSTTDDYGVAVKEEEAALDVSNELSELNVPSEPIYITSDTTEEKLAVLLSQNGESIGVLSSEAGIFDIMAGRYSDKPSLDIYLKGHAGDAHQVHRIGREDILLKRPVITMGLMVQPDLLKSIGGITSFRGRGLLARFMYVWCASRAGTRKLNTTGIHEKVRHDYAHAIQELLRGELKEQAAIHLSDGARRCWETFYATAEASLRPGGELCHLPDWGSKLPGAVARIAGLFHFADNGRDAADKIVSTEIMEAAVALGGYFADHARIVFAIMDEDAQLSGARRILEALRRHKVQQFKVRDIFNITGYRKTSEITPGVEILLEHGWVREISTGYSGKGRPRGHAYEVHPSVWK